jgi:hypothetical protein
LCQGWGVWSGGPRTRRGRRSLGTVTPTGHAGTAAGPSPTAPEPGDAFRAGEGGFRLLFAANPMPMWVYDRRSLRFLEVNEAAAIMGINQPKVSALVRGHLEGLSLERLARYLIALGQDVEIVVWPAHDEAHLQVCTAH